ncbi:MAG: DUF4854 domain-containing protein [Clostridiales bacterium]|nr:DUF4854 domain-containing protein [Clostridiales bacterium]
MFFAASVGIKEDRTMKKKKVLSLLICFTMLMSIFITACSKGPATLEEYISKDQEAKDQIETTAESSGLSVSIEGNNVVYTYDLQNMSGVTADIAKDDTMKSTLESALDSAAATFENLCAQLEKESEISGIQIIVNYTYGDETIVTKTFSAPAASSSDEG